MSSFLPTLGVVREKKEGVGEKMRYTEVESFYNFTYAVSFFRRNMIVCIQSSLTTNVGICTLIFSSSSSGWEKR